MKKLSQTIMIQLMSWIVSPVVLFALCFSIGEGLRLTPFPVSTLTIDEASDHHFAIKASQEVSLHKYGPLDIPPQNQKRNKRHVVEFVCAPSEIVRKLPTCLYSSCNQQAPQVVSALLVSSLAGRDPPSSS